MKYKITIRKCADPGRAQEIAQGIAKWSGSSPDVVLKVIVEKPVCIKREAEEEEALRIKSQFEVYGAEVDLIPLQEEEFALSSLPPAAAVAAPVTARTAAPTQAYSAPASQKRVQQPVKAQNSSWDEDDEEQEGRLLTDEEFTELLKRRPDIFYFDTSSRLRNMTLVSVLLGIGFGFWMTHVEFVNVATDFYEKLPEERTAKFVTAAELPKTLEEKKKEDKKKDADIQTEDKKRLKPKPTKGGGGTSGGGGDPRARVTQKGVLGIVSGAVKGKTVASADIFGKGGFATGIDAIISGTGGLKSGGGGGTGRKGVAGIGYGAGYGSGFGGSGSGGVDDLIGNLMGGDGGGLDLKKKGALKLNAPDFIKGGSLTGGRSRASIQRVVMQNMAALRYAYNKRLRDKPGLTGKITVKWAIDEFGKVLFAQVVESTINDPELETVVKEKIMRWVFEKIDKPGDVTECVYPFVFSN
jgi:hypothetical protein